jgi:cytochrome c551/c552
MDYISKTSVDRICEALAIASDKACTSLHREQCKIVDSASLDAAAKLETVLRIQRELVRLERSFARAIYQLEGPRDPEQPTII